MWNFIPNEDHLREVLFHYFILKKTAAQTYEILVEAYGNLAPTEDTCERWFNRFKSVDIDMENKVKEKQSKKLQELVDEDSTQTQSQLTEKSASESLYVKGKIKKEEKWLPYDLTETEMRESKSHHRTPAEKKSTE